MTMITFVLVSIDLDCVRLQGYFDGTIRFRRYFSCSVVMLAVRNIGLIHVLAAVVAYGLVPAATAQQPGPRDQVVVTSNLDPVPFENLSRTVTVLTREEIGRMPVRSIAEVLDYASSVDVNRVRHSDCRRTCRCGALPRRKCSFWWTIRMNNSQTAHHNSDFPVQLQEVERIEILKGAGSSLYGADAFGGTINIITRRDVGKVNASLMGGQFGFFEGSFGASFRKAGIDQSFSASADRSTGFMYDRDFTSLSFSSRTGFGKSSLFISHRRDEFGANGFYGPAPSREWENQTIGFKFEQQIAVPALDSSVFVRTMDARTHFSTMSGPLTAIEQSPDPRGWNNGEIEMVFGRQGCVHFGAEAGATVIRSSNLGDHEYGRLICLERSSGSRRSN